MITFTLDLQCAGCDAGVWGREGSKIYMDPTLAYLPAKQQQQQRTGTFSGEDTLRRTCHILQFATDFGSVSEIAALWRTELDVVYLISLQVVLSP